MNPKNRWLELKPFSLVTCFGSQCAARCSFGKQTGFLFDPTRGGWVGAWVGLAGGTGGWVFHANICLASSLAAPRYLFAKQEL